MLKEKIQFFIYCFLSRGTLILKKKTKHSNITKNIADNEKSVSLNGGFFLSMAGLNSWQQTFFYIFPLLYFAKQWHLHCIYILHDKF